MRKRSEPGRKNGWTRLLAGLLAFVLIISSTEISIFATDDDQDSTSIYVEEETGEENETDEEGSATNEAAAAEEDDSETEAAETVEEAALETGVLLLMYQDETGAYFIDIEMTVEETASVQAEGVSVKMILPAGLSVTDESLEALAQSEAVTVIDSVADEVEAELAAAEADDGYEMLLAELAEYDSAELASYGAAIVWSDQTVAAGGSNTYTLTVAADEAVYDGSTGLYFVNGTAVDESNIEVTDEETQIAVVAEDEEITVAVAAVAVESSASDYDGTALKAYADELMETYGLKVTVTQSPAGGSEVLSGDAVTWYVTVTIPTAENYSEFSTYNKTLWDSYDDLTVTLAAPDGITITGVTASGYTTAIENNAAVVSFGDITANSQTLSFSVTGYIDADPAPATGTTYTLTADDVTYSTSITVKDRTVTPNADVATYTVTGTTSTDLSGFTLTSKTNDDWELTKTQKSADVVNGQLVVVYTIELIMNDYASLSEYTVNGRVNFDSFSIVDTPTITYNGTTYSPTTITAVNYTTGQKTTGTTSVTINDYADLDTTGLTETTTSGRSLDGDVPVYTTYTVTAYYDGDFSSDFYDVITYDVNNTAELNYTFEYANGTQPQTGTDTKSVTKEYTNSAEPATIDLHKIIRSIYTGGDYVTGTSLDSDYTGSAEFTITDANGNAAELYALIDKNGDGEAEYVRISNVITITRDSSGNAGLYVTYYEEESTTATTSLLTMIINAVASLFSSNSKSVEYSGLLYLNAGTYSIAETDNDINYTSFTEFTADTGTTLTSEDGTTYSFTLTDGQAATINAYNTETRGDISFNKSVTNYQNSNSTTTVSLEGAEFTLYSNQECTTEIQTATSNSQGVVTFTKLDPGTYYIKETKALEGCLLDTRTYTVTVEANKTTTTFTDNTGTVYNERNAATLTFEKYLLSTDTKGNVIQVAVDDTRIETVFTTGVFVLQQSGDGGKTWTTLDRTVTLKRDTDDSGTTVSAAELSALPVYTDSTRTTAYQYRIVETLPDGYSLVTLFTGDNGDDINAKTATSEGVTTVTTDSFTLVDGDTTVSLTNQTTGEVSVYKQYVQANTDGANTSSATTTTATTVYLLKKTDSGDYELVDTATTDENGNATIADVDILTGSGSTTAQQYYWAEAESNSVYSSYALEGGSTIQVDVDGDGTKDTEMYLLSTVAYATAYESINSKSTLTNILPYVRVKLYKKSTSNGSYVSGAGYTVYRVNNDGSETEYTSSDSTIQQNTSGTVASGGSTLVLEAGYVYHVRETTVPTNYSGLKDADGNDIDYITIDLTGAIPDDQNDYGVLQGTTAAEGTLYDEPYPTLTLIKKQVAANNTESSAKDYDAIFAIYQCDTKDGAYTLYQSSYTANSSVSLQPGYYYAFVEQVEDGYIAPEVYSGTGTVSGADLKLITISGGSTAYAYVTDSAVEANNTYTIGTVTNYSNYSSVTVTKYAYDTSASGSATLSGAVIGIYADAGCTTLIKSATTGANGTVSFANLSVYDKNGDKITYYIKEIDAPDGYFESDTVLEVQLTAGTVTTTDTSENALNIYDEPELTVSVPVVWIDCDPDTGEANWVSQALAGATVYLYKAEYDTNGTIVTYTLEDSVTSKLDDDGSAYATFTGLRHDQDYVFVLGMSGVTDEDAENYPLYASADYTDSYVGDTAPGTLTTEQLESYQYISYKNTDITARTDTETTPLKNYLLHIQVDIQKYCLTNHGSAREITLSDGPTAYYVNGALFYLYRQKLTDEQLAALANGGDVELTYDATALERVSSDTSSGTGEASVKDTYDDTYVYWLVEAATGTAHTWPYTEDGNGNKTYASYYRVLLYPEVLTASGGNITATNATKVQSFDPTDVTELEVENSCGTGYHEYMVTTVFMNKWGGYYDQYGEDTEDYSPLSNVTFQYSLVGTSQSFIIDGADAQETKGNISIQNGEDADENGNTQADNDAGQGKTTITFALLLNQWYVAVAQAAGLSVDTITDITTSSSNLCALEQYDGWSNWEGMLYVATTVDAADANALTDLAANSGTVAMQILYAFANAYPSCEIDLTKDNPYDTYVSCMENVLCENLSSGLNATTYLVESYGYKSYYAHIVIEETKTAGSSEYGNYALNTEDYELYLQFRGTNANGLANVKYFYLDSVDRTDYYYDSDPEDVDIMGLDASFVGVDGMDNTERTQIVNMPVLNYSLTVTKYGYNLTSATLNKTDDQLDTYYFGDGTTAAVGSSTDLMPLSSTFVLQRYDTSGTTAQWRYYSAAEDKYVDTASEAQFTTDNTTGQYSTSLPLGYYRLIEVSVDGGDTNYEVILDGTSVTVYDSDGEATSTTAEAVRYFWITKQDSDGSNTVNVYDPQSADLYIEKYSLSNTSTKKSGVTITLTDGTNTYTATWDSSTRSYVIRNLPAGTYTVNETAASGSVTNAYFQSFTITVGFGRGAAAGTAEQDSSVTEYDTYVTGVETSISGQVACSVEGCQDSITGSVTASGAAATLKIHNPSTGSLTITKTDSSTGNTVTSGTATFALYYQAFAVDSSDAYVADTSTAPTYTAGDSAWKLVNDFVTTTNGVATVSSLTPGWYAIVETSAPSGYERNSEVQVVAVVADMNSAHTLTDSGQVSVTVADTKMVGLSVTKSFNLEDFKDDLLSDAGHYSVTYGLYVYDTVSKSYVSAYSLGLTTTKEMTVQVTNSTSGSVTTATGTWADLIQMEAYLQNEDDTYTVAANGTTYELDGCYYIKEEAVIYTDPDTKDTTDMTSDWWVSNAAMSSTSSSGLSVTKMSGGYYQVSGFQNNATGTVEFTNDLAYATVTIQKVDTYGNPLEDAEFTVYSDADCTNPVATGTTNENGLCTITVPVTATGATNFYIRETVAPEGYTLYEDTITVSLKSGQKVSYTDSGSGLTITDSNGVYVKLLKYDNIHDYSGASPLSDVTFTLLRSTDGGTTWSVLRTYTTSTTGQINFDTLINSTGTVYMLAEVGYNSTLYDGLESMWYTVTTEDSTSGAVSTTDEAALTESTVTVNGVDYTGYQFSLQDIAAGSTYQLYAYNQPRPTVTFTKKGDGTGTAVPTATLEIYQVDADTYSASDTLTATEVTAAKTGGSYVTTVTTTAVSGAEYSSATCNLSAGTYLVVETATSGGGYVINKDDADEVWYQIIQVPSDGTKTVTVESFVNVTQEYGVTLDKTGTTQLTSDILASEADLEYTLDVDVTNSGPINGLTVTDSGLTVTKIWSGVGSGATEETVSADDSTKYLDGDYSITSVKIPVDASYNASSLVFTSGDKDSFTSGITAKVVFYDADGNAVDTQTAKLSDVSTTDGYWTVTPSNSNVKAVSFTVTWYDETLELYTGYQLGSDFTVSDSDSHIVVAMHIDRQNGGTADYYAVAEIQNSAQVDYTYTSWDTTGTATEDLPATASDTALTQVPNASAAKVDITKTVVNETTGSTSEAVIGNTLKYTITLTNSSTSLAMDAPVILDLLPQGVVAASAASEDSFLANVEITSSSLGSDSTLAITNVWRERSDGYTLLEIVTSGSLAPGETVTITLEAEVDSTILNYLSSSAQLTNTAWVTSSTQGTTYHDNTAGAVFMGSTGSWAGNYDSSTTAGSMLSVLLGSDYLGFTGYGYISDSAAITFQATSAVTILKEVQGDQDEDDGNWYHGDEGGTVTANTSDATTDDGYANFRLTVTNMNDGQNLVNIVLMDIVPKENGASFNSNITKSWSLNFDGITSITIGGTEITDYTLWYYTGSVSTSAGVTDMQAAFDTRETDTNSKWVTESNYSGDKSDITAFAVVFDSSVTLGYQQTLKLTYKAAVPQMNEDTASDKAHLATYNDFRLIYQLETAGTTSTDTFTLDSNYVYALLETEPVGVGGMLWIDANGDGIQDSEDVTPDTYTASTDRGAKESTATTYNGRVNDYATYSVVRTLLNSASVQLLTYNGATNSQVTNFSTLTGGAWRFLFDDLTSANISSSYTGDVYDSSGILWKALAGSTNASWYQLLVTIAGSGSIKYSLTRATADVYSYDPAEVYSTAATDKKSATLYDSNFRTSKGKSGVSTITTGSTTAYSEKFFLYGAAGDSAQWNLSEDIGLVIYRDLQITKNDTDGSSPASGSIFAVYGPYAAGEAQTVTALDSAKLVGTYTTTEDNPTTLLVEDLLYFQEYIIVETSADSSYELDAAVATGTNITSTTVTLDSETYTSAWILGIPTNNESAKDVTTDPTAFNDVTTDNMTVTNAKKMTVTLIKIDGAGVNESNFTSAAKLAGAEFALYKETDVTVDALTGKVTLNTGATALATATSDENGTVKFADNLLETGVYYLFETKAPDGYELLTRNYWKVTVNTAKKTLSVEGGGTAYSDSTTGYYYIPNYTQYTLPSTDGYGRPILWITLFGCLLMVAAACLWMSRKRRDGAERA